MARRLVRKVGITITKYMPQVALNIRRRATVGWSIDNVLLDLTGRRLSLGHGPNPSA